ncbi:DUF2252 family protein [Fulvimarina sp. 2208YS6-2-32]|uniref:DUF2252 family protein n=1 Tax=Fulvimarina uroteuthidis TaxID=3098149 RepID=A0ABU5I2G5_9HYPH|nr:DUF2252 family protein [Fulvimarina sp. 2208YS6-2-32]MDY8109544.1 DUF2252 family protein [Fulvimarina sp. 2208YS6-2-32]
MGDRNEERRRLILNEIERVDDQAPTADDPSRKHAKMSLNPFRFMRGSVQIFYNDLSTGVLTLPSPLTETVKKTGIMGDCHTSNFGFVTEKGSGGGLIIFAPDDFDDACVGHAAWDVCRFLVSLHLSVDLAHGILDSRYSTDAFDDLEGLVAPTEDETRAAAAAFLAAYRATLLTIIDNPLHRRTVLHEFEKHHILWKALKKARKRAIGGKNFETKSKLGKAVIANGAELRFRDKPGRLKRLGKKEEAEVRGNFRKYVGDTIVDVVERIGQGTGSLNVKRYYLLVGPKGASTMAELPLCHLVEVKQQRHAAALHFFPDLDPRNELNPAHLTAAMQRLMQREPDLLLDEAEWKSSHWLIRSRHHASVSLDPEEICLHPKQSGKRLLEYAEACAVALAHAHSRTDHRSTRFETMLATALAEAGDALLETAEAYSRQVISDWTMMRDMTGIDPTHMRKDR